MLFVHIQCLRGLITHSDVFARDGRSSMRQRCRGGKTKALKPRRNNSGKGSSKRNEVRFLSIQFWRILLMRIWGFGSVARHTLGELNLLKSFDIFQKLFAFL